MALDTVVALMGHLCVCYPQRVTYHHLIVHSPTKYTRLDSFTRLTLEILLFHVLESGASSI